MLFHDAVIAGLQRHNVIFFEHDTTVTVPIPTGDSGYFLIDIHVDEEAGDALLNAGIYRVPQGRREAVALTLTELSAKRKHIVWSMRENTVVADICVDLDLARDPEHAFMLAFFRLSSAIAEEHDQVVRAGRRSRSRVERELDEILSKGEN